MGWDIYGCIEYQPEVETDTTSALPWRYALDLADLYDGRNYDSFGSLFGLKNWTGLAPLAASRGLPDNASTSALTALSARLEHQSYITWHELKAADWDELGTEPDKRLKKYKKNADGSCGKLVGGALWDADIAKQLHFAIDEAYESTFSWTVGSQWDVGDYVFRAEVRRRRDTVDGGWDPVWKAMDELAEKYGDTHVRLLVGFSF